MEQEIIAGRKPVLDALSSGTSFDKIFVSKGSVGKEIDEITLAAKQQQIPVQLVPKEKIEDFLKKNKAEFVNHQGVVGVIQLIEYSSIDDVLKLAEDKNEAPLILILDAITDVHNFGAIARSAECMGVHGIIIQKTGSAPINPVAVKISAGALLNIPVCREQSIITCIKTLRAHGLKIYGADIEKSEQIGNVNLTEPLALVMGSEGEGITPIIKKFCDGLISIPMTGKTESLNVSVSTGIILYEIMRQRKK